MQARQGTAGGKGKVREYREGRRGAGRYSDALQKQLEIEEEGEEEAEGGRRERRREKAEGRKRKREKK